MTEPEAADLDRVGSAGTSGVVWFLEGSRDLNVNLVALRPHDAIADHVNDDVDVVVVVVDGAGTVTVDGASHPLGRHRVVLMSRGTPRSISAGAEGLRYLSIHRRRDTLAPRPRATPSPTDYEPGTDEGGDPACWAHLFEDED